MTRGEIHVARHPAVAVSGICYGRADVPLAGDPSLAARELRDAWPGAPPAVVWSSPSSRCATVAAALSASFRASLQLDARLLELDFGAWEGRAWDAIAHDDAAAHDAWMADWKIEAPPSGETLAAFTSRVRAWLSDLPASGVAHAVVAHAGVIRALRVLVDGDSWDAAMAGSVPHLAWRRFILPARAPEPSPLDTRALCD